MGFVTTCKVGVDFETRSVLFQSMSAKLGWCSCACGVGTKISASTNQTPAATNDRPFTMTNLHMQSDRADTGWSTLNKRLLSSLRTAHLSEDPGQVQSTWPFQLASAHSPDQWPKPPTRHRSLGLA